MCVLCVYRMSAAVILGGSRHLVARKPGKWKHILYSSLASVTCGGALCAIPFRQASTLTQNWTCLRFSSLVFAGLLFLLACCYSVAGRWPVPWLSHQTSCVSGDRQLQHLPLAGHTRSHKRHHRILQSKFSHCSFAVSSFIFRWTPYLIKGLTHFQK